jgi:hypothetical protein
MVCLWLYLAYIVNYLYILYLTIVNYDVNYSVRFENAWSESALLSFIIILFVPIFMFIYVEICSYIVDNVQWTSHVLLSLNSNNIFK